MHLENVALIVDDYDSAIDFFVDKLDFELVEDLPARTNAGRRKRWVVVRPPNARTGLLLVRADGESQSQAVGEQFAGRVGLFLRVDEFDATYRRMRRGGVEFVTDPRTDDYGQVAVFLDISGNRWDLPSGLPQPRADRMARRLGAMGVVEDPAELARAGDWILAGTHGWARVHSFVPEVFESYARVFHPAMREAEERDLPLRVPGESRTGAPMRIRDNGVLWCEVRWTEVARANGRVAHPGMEWTAITGSYRYDWHGAQPGIWDLVPRRGSLPLRVARRLCEQLAGFTDTVGICWGAGWRGNGNMIGLRSDPTLPRLAMPERPMIVARGPLGAVAEASFTDGFDTWDSREHPQFEEHYRSPSLWWPDDRAWCVATDVDLQTSYIGASAECVTQLVEDDQLEVMPVPSSQSVAIDADTVNPTLSETAWLADERWASYTDLAQAESNGRAPKGSRRRPRR